MLLLQDTSNGTNSSLSNLQTRHRTGDIVMGVGAGQADVQLKVSVFRRARTGNSYCFLDLESLYEALNLTSYQGYASRWVNKNYEKWVEKLRVVLQGLDDDMFVHSSQRAESQQCKKKNATPWETRCLDSGSMCATAFFGLLARLVGLNGQGGGLENVSAKAAGRDLLDAFVRAHDCILH